MKRVKGILAGILIVALCIGMYPIVNVNAAKKSKVSLNKTKVTIFVGKTVSLKLKNNKKAVKWITSNKKIATVSNKGKVKGKKAGKVTITAKVGKKKYKCKVTVKKKPDNKPVEQVTTRPTEQATTKPVESTTTRPVEQTTTTSEEITDLNNQLNPAISQNVTVLKSIVDKMNSGENIDYSIISKIENTNNTETNKVNGFMSGFVLEDAIQTIKNDSVRYNNYVGFHGGFYDSKYYKTDEYEGVFEFNDAVLNYLVDGTTFEPEPSRGYEAAGNVYKYMMFYDKEYSVTFNYNYQYKNILSKFLKCGYPKIENIDYYILVASPISYDSEGGHCEGGFEYEQNITCTNIITFISDGKIYNAYIEFSMGMYAEYKLLDLECVYNSTI